MLQETRAELDDFQRSSKELEEELERELERTEKAMEDLRVKATRAEMERDEWKVSVNPLVFTACGPTAFADRPGSCPCKRRTIRLQHLFNASWTNYGSLTNNSRFKCAN